MVICGNCGNIVKEDEEWCRLCGKYKDKEKYGCPYCGSPTKHKNSCPNNPKYWR